MRAGPLLSVALASVSLPTVDWALPCVQALFLGCVAVLKELCLEGRCLPIIMSLLSTYCVSLKAKA